MNDIYEIKSLFQDHAAIRENIYRKYIEKGGIKIFCKGQTMTMSAEQMKENVAFRSKKAVKDKFSDEMHILLYYKWIPD